MSQGMRQTVAVVMAKFPVAGLVKSRLCLSGAMTTEEAAQVARLMLRCIVLRVGQRWPTIVATSPDQDVAHMKDLLSDLPTHHSLVVIGQGEGTLGERMDRVWRQHVKSGSIVFFGGDSPDVPERYLDLMDSFLADGADGPAAIGHAPDGGYWALASRCYMPALLEDIPWSSQTVFEVTCQRLRQSGHEPVVLPTWPDVDTFEDLQNLLERLSETNFEGLSGDWSEPRGRGGYHESTLQVMEALRQGIGKLLLKRDPESD